MPSFPLRFTGLFLVNGSTGVATWIGVAPAGCTTCVGFSFLTSSGIAGTTCIGCAIVGKIA